MKNWMIAAGLAVVLASCGNSAGDGTAEDTTSPASGATGMGPDGTATDTTGLDVGAVQPVDSTPNRRIIGDEPGADRSHVYDKIDTNGGQ